MDMDKKPSQDAMEAMREMVQHAMDGGCSSETIIRDVMGWGDVKGFTEIMILDEIRAYQKEHESKPGSPVIVHSPADMPPPVKPVEKPPVAQSKPSPDHKKTGKPKSTPENIKLMEYARAAARDRKNTHSEGILIKMVKTRRDNLKADMGDDFLTLMCMKFWEQRNKDDWKDLLR